MKLLVLSPVHPDAPSDGDRVRLYHWLRELGRRNEIHVIAFGDPARPADAAILRGGGVKSARVTLVPSTLMGRRIAALTRLLSPLPVSVTSASSWAMTRAVDRAIADAAAAGKPFDALFCYRLKMAPYALRFRGPRFLDYTDSLTRYAERRAVAEALAGNPLKARWRRLQARKTAAYEAWCAGQFDAGFFNSVQDCETLRAMAPGFKERLHVAANGVAQFLNDGRRRTTVVRRGVATPGRATDVGRLPSSRRSQRMVFVGHLAYPPNAEAVAWFADHVLPLIRQAEPDAELQVIGGDAPAGLLARAGRPGLRFSGPVPDVAAALAGAALSVCPVRTGAGRQNKLLEAFAAGIPAVSTGLAAEGAEAVAGRDLLVADGSRDFAEACVRLLRSPALGRRLAAGGRRLVGRLYQWKRNAAGLERVMRQTIPRHLW